MSGFTLTGNMTFDGGFNIPLPVEIIIDYLVVGGGGAGVAGYGGGGGGAGGGGLYA
jgi:hypothetical protein